MQDRQLLFAMLSALRGQYIRLYPTPEGQPPVEGCLTALGSEGAELLTAEGRRTLAYDEILRAEALTGAAPAPGSRQEQLLCTLMGFLGKPVRCVSGGRAITGVLARVDLSQAELFTSEGPVALALSNVESVQSGTQAQATPAAEPPAVSELLRQALAMGGQQLYVRPNAFEQAILDGDRSRAAALLNEGYLSSDALDYTSEEIETIRARLASSVGTFSWEASDAYTVAQRILFVQKNKHRLAHVCFVRAEKDCLRRGAKPDAIVRALFIVLQSEKNHVEIKRYYETYECLRLKLDGSPNLHNEAFYRLACQTLEAEGGRPAPQKTDLTRFMTGLKATYPPCNGWENALRADGCTSASLLELLQNRGQMARWGYREAECADMAQRLAGAEPVRGKSYADIAARLRAVQGNRNRQAERWALQGLATDAGCRDACLGILLHFYLEEGRTEELCVLAQALPDALLDRYGRRLTNALLSVPNAETLLLGLLKRRPALAMQRPVLDALLAMPADHFDGTTAARMRFLRSQLPGEPVQLSPLEASVAAGDIPDDLPDGAQRQHLEAARSSDGWPASGAFGPLSEGVRLFLGLNVADRALPLLLTAFAETPKAAAPWLLRAWTALGAQDAQEQFFALWPELAAQPELFSARLTLLLRRQDAFALTFLRQDPLACASPEILPGLCILARQAGDANALALLALLADDAPLDGLARSVIQCDASLLVHARDGELLQQQGYTADEAAHIAAVYAEGSFPRGGSCTAIGRRLALFLGGRGGLAEIFLRAAGPDGEASLYELLRRQGQTEDANALLLAAPSLQAAFPADHLRLLMACGEAEKACGIPVAADDAAASLLHARAMLAARPQAFAPLPSGGVPPELARLDAILPDAALLESAAAAAAALHVANPDAALTFAVRWVTALAGCVPADQLTALAFCGQTPDTPGLAEEQELLLKSPSGALLALWRSRISALPLTPAQQAQADGKLALLRCADRPDALPYLRMLCALYPDQAAQWLPQAQEILRAQPDTSLLSQNLGWMLAAAAPGQLPELLRWLRTEGLLWDASVLDRLLALAGQGRTAGQPLPEAALPIAEELTDAVLKDAHPNVSQKLLPLYRELLETACVPAQAAENFDRIIRTVAEKLIPADEPVPLELVWLHYLALTAWGQEDSARALLCLMEYAHRRVPCAWLAPLLDRERARRDDGALDLTALFVGTFASGSLDAPLIFCMRWNRYLSLSEEDLRYRDTLFMAARAGQPPTSADLDLLTRLLIAEPTRREAWEMLARADFCRDGRARTAFLCVQACLCTLAKVSEPDGAWQAALAQCSPELLPQVYLLWLRRTNGTGAHIGAEKALASYWEGCSAGEMAVFAPFANAMTNHVLRNTLRHPTYESWRFCCQVAVRLDTEQFLLSEEAMTCLLDNTESIALLLLANLVRKNRFEDAAPLAGRIRSRMPTYRSAPLLLACCDSPSLLEDAGVQDALALICQKQDGNWPGIEQTSAYVARALLDGAPRAAVALRAVQQLLRCNAPDPCLQYARFVLYCALPDADALTACQYLLAYVQNLDPNGRLHSIDSPATRLTALYALAAVRDPDGAAALPPLQSARCIASHHNELYRELGLYFTSPETHRCALRAVLGGLAGLLLEYFRAGRALEPSAVFEKLDPDSLDRSAASAMLLIEPERRDAFSSWLHGQTIFSGACGSLTGAPMQELLRLADETGQGAALAKALALPAFDAYLSDAILSLCLPPQPDAAVLTMFLYALEWLRPASVPTPLQDPRRVVLCRVAGLPQAEGLAVFKRLVSLPLPAGVRIFNDIFYDKGKPEELRVSFGSYVRAIPMLAYQYFQNGYDDLAWLACRAMDGQPWREQLAVSPLLQEQFAVLTRLVGIFRNDAAVIQTIQQTGPKGCANLALLLLSGKRAPEFLRLRRVLPGWRGELCALIGEIYSVRPDTLFRNVPGQPWMQILERIGRLCATPAGDDSTTDLCRALLYRIAQRWWNRFGSFTSDRQFQFPLASGEAKRLFDAAPRCEQVDSWLLGKRSTRQWAQQCAQTSSPAILLPGPRATRARKASSPTPLRETDLPPLPEEITALLAPSQAAPAPPSVTGGCQALAARLRSSALWQSCLKQYAGVPVMDPDEAHKRCRLTVDPGERQACYYSRLYPYVENQQGQTTFFRIMNDSVSLALNTSRCLAAAGGGQTAASRNAVRQPFYDLASLVELRGPAPMQVESGFFSVLDQALALYENFDEMAGDMRRNQAALQLLLGRCTGISVDEQALCRALKDVLSCALNAGELLADDARSNAQKADGLRQLLDRCKTFDTPQALGMRTPAQLRGWVNAAVIALSDSIQLKLSVLNTEVLQNGCLYGVLTNNGSRAAGRLRLEAVCGGQKCLPQLLERLSPYGGSAPFALHFSLPQAVGSEVDYAFTVACQDGDGVAPAPLCVNGTLPVAAPGRPLLPALYNMATISDPRDMIGRREERAKLEALYGPGKPPSEMIDLEVYGLKRTGKSTLLHLAEHILNAHPEAFAIYVDCELFSDAVQAPTPLWEIFIHQPLLAAEKRFPLDGDPAYQEFRRSYIAENRPLSGQELDLAAQPFLLEKEFYPRLRALVGAMPVLLLDEADVLLNRLEHSGPTAQQLYHVLRSLMDHCGDMRLIFCGSDLLQSFSFERTAVSQLLDAFGAKLPVGRFNYADHCALLKSVCPGTDLVYPDETLETSWLCTAGHAWHTKALGTLILEKLREEHRAVAYPSDVINAMQNLIREGAAYEKLRENLSPAERTTAGVLQGCLPDLSSWASEDEILQAMGELQSRTVTLSALDTLVRRDIVAQKFENGATRYRFATGLYLCWFSRTAVSQRRRKSPLPLFTNDITAVDLDFDVL